MGIEMVEVAEELIEPMIAREMTILISEMVLTELAGDITEGLQQFGDGRILFHDSFFGTGEAHFKQSCPEGRLSGDESRATGRATILSVPIGEQCTLLRDAIDVGGLVPQHAAIVATGIIPPYIIAPDDEDVGLFLVYWCRF